jgi:hypothetical protein
MMRPIDKLSLLLFSNEENVREENHCSSSSLSVAQFFEWAFTHEEAALGTRMKNERRRMKKNEEE